MYAKPNKVQHCGRYMIQHPTWADRDNPAGPLARELRIAAPGEAGHHNRIVGQNAEEQAPIL